MIIFLVLLYGLLILLVFFFIEEDIEKLDLLYDVKTAFTIGEQNTVLLNDVEARWMHNKSGNNERLYSIYNQHLTQNPN